jgi:ESCRT-II complex subunit VPS25
LLWSSPLLTTALRLLPGVRQQPNPATQATVTEQWTKLILSYARFRRLFILRVEDAETSGGDWDEVLRNPRINRAYVVRVGAFLR